MNEVDDFRQIKRIFWITFVIGLLTFFCPFLEGNIRGMIYWEVFKGYLLADRNFPTHFWIVLILLVSILLWLPMIGYAFYRYTAQKRYYTIKQRLVNYFLFAIGMTIYVLPVYAVFGNGLELEELKAFDWGYWLLLICTTILFVCYLKIQKAQLIEYDLSAHLIIEDEK